jgi:hypothetical protein
MLRSQMSVSHGDLNGLVPHQLLNRTDVHPCHHETTGERVAEVVPVEVGDPCIRKRDLEPSPGTNGFRAVIQMSKDVSFALGR